MAKSSRNRYASQINSETSLKFGPQMDALAMLLSNAQGDRNQGLAVNASTARAASEAARLAQPEVGKANESYLAQLLQAKTTLGADTAGLSPAADSFKASSARDMANAQTRAAETTKAASQELTQRGLDARSGAMLGARQVQDRYGQQVDQIDQQRNALSGQAGAFASSRLAELLGEDAKTAHDSSQKGADRRTSLLTAGVNPDGTVIPGGKADPAVKNKPKAVKWATPAQAGRVQDTIAGAQAQAEKLHAAGRSRAEVAQLMVGGRPSQQVQDPNTGMITTVPGVAKVPQLYASVALDLLFDGHVSKKNVDQLHKRRIKVSDLGFPTQAPRKPASRPAAPAPGLPLGPLAPVTVG